MPDSEVRIAELTGPPDRLEFPDICASCGQFANEKILIEKVFERSSSQHGWQYSVEAARVPFCPACTTKHHSEARTVTRLQRMLMCFRAGIIVAALGSGGFALFMAYLALKEVAERDVQSAGFLGWVAAGFAVVSALTFRTAYQETRRHAIVPATSVTGAFDFSDDLSELFEAERHNYMLRNAYFGGAFIERNRGKVWDPKGKRASKAKTKRNAAIGIFLLLLLIALAWSLFKDWTSPTP